METDLNSVSITRRLAPWLTLGAVVLVVALAIAGFSRAHNWHWSAATIAQQLDLDVEAIGRALVQESANQQLSADFPSQQLPAAAIVDYANGRKLTGYTSSYTGPAVVGTCSDCQYFPVDKTWALPAGYAPTVVASGLPGGGLLTAPTAAALKQLFAAANAAGLHPKINSAYRSYQEQQVTFNYWLNGELSRGVSRAQAEINANRYSARPGHSEHQLGTTADVACGNASAFDRENQCNNANWAFIAAHAHEYGFVISYPSGLEALTGYVYEPWHLRFIGKDLATELFQRGYLNGSKANYPSKFLREKKLY